MTIKTQIDNRNFTFFLLINCKCGKPLIITRDSYSIIAEAFINLDRFLTFIIMAFLLVYTAKYGGKVIKQNFKV